MRCKSVTAISMLMLLSAFSEGFAADPDASGPILAKDVVFEEVGGVVAAEAGKVTGELKKWHKLTLTVDGPQASEECRDEDDN